MSDIYCSGDSSAGQQNSRVVKSVDNSLVATGGIAGPEGNPSLVVRDAPTLNQKYNDPVASSVDTCRKIDVGKFKFKELKRLSPAEKRMDEILREENDLHGEIHRRDCLANALKTKCEWFVQSLGWENGDLADQLIEKGCLTDDENSTILSTRRGHLNPMRAVLMLLVSRDFRTLLSFTSCILEINTNVIEAILKQYDSLVSENDVTTETCTLCLLKSRVHVAMVTDRLWSKGLVDDQVYGQVSKLDVCLGGQEEFWAEIAAVSEHTNILPDIAEVLEMCGFHSDLVKLIREDERRGQRRLECRCGPRMAFLKPVLPKDDDCDSGNGLDREELEFSSEN